MTYNSKMSWASRRRATYLFGVIVFFVLVIGVPVAYHFLTIPATCTDGKQNQGETDIDKGGPCPVLDARALQHEAILWTRAFRVRDGSYTAAAYIQNPNEGAGVMQVGYKFGLYDSNNILIAERSGSTFIMPSGVTPVIEAGIDTGNRIVAHTYAEFTTPLTWERIVENPASSVEVTNKQLDETSPRLTANVRNTSVAPVISPSFAAVLFDQQGNAIAASRTSLDRLDSDQIAQIVFTWPQQFSARVGRIDIIPYAPPVPDR